MRVLIVPAVIAKGQDELDEMLDKVKGKVKRIMLDVMDNKFVPNSSLEFDFKVPMGFVYEAHLMVTNPLEWIADNRDKVDIAILQVETLEDIGGAIVFAKEKGLKVTLALNPDTGLDSILPFLDEIDAVLILTVNPGSFCVEFLPETLEKIKRLREIDKDISIEVDGCMNPENAKLAKEAGATIYASGSYVLKSADPEKAIKNLEDAVK